MLTSPRRRRESGDFASGARGRPPWRRGSRDSALLQLRLGSDGQAVTAARALDAAAAEHAAKTFSSQIGVGTVLQLGMRAVAVALEFLQDRAHQLAISQMTMRVIEAIENFIPPEMRTESRFLDFVEAMADRTQSTIDELGENVTAMAESGSSDDIIGTISSVLCQMSAMATRFLPPQVGEYVVKFLAAIVDGLEGAGEAVDLVEEGHQKEGVEAYYAGMKAAVNGLVPHDMQNGATYTWVLNATDSEMGSIVRSLVFIVRDVLDIKVCWKRTVRRDRTRPHVCPLGFHLIDDTRLCAPDAGNAEVQPARCSVSAEPRGSWCYWNCPAGYQPSFNHCRQICVGKYFVNSPLMCGTEEGSIRLAILEVSAKAIATAGSLHGLESIVADGVMVIAAYCTAVMTAFVEMAKPFGHPSCPDPFSGVDRSSLLM